jgi:hypothetical protein
MEVGLKEYVDVLFEAQRRELDQATARHDREIDRRFSDLRAETAVSLNTLNTRLTGMNEIREQLTAQANTFGTKESVETLRGRIDKLENRQAGVYSWVAGLGAAISVVVALWAVFAR